MKKKTLYGIIALIIAAVIVIVAGIGSSVNGKWFKNKDIETWFNSWGQTTVQDPEGPNEPTTPTKPGVLLSWGKAVDNKGNQMNNSTTYALPAALSFYSDIDESAIETTSLEAPEITVTATQSFELNNLAVIWSLRYADGSTGAANKIKLTQDGSLTAKIQCLEPFEKQITLKVELQNQPEVFTTTTIDYVKRINAMDFSGLGCNDLPAENVGPNVSFDFGQGTAMGEIRISYFDFSDYGFINNKMQEYLKFNICSASKGFNNVALELADGTDYYNEAFTFGYGDFIDGFDQYDEAHKTAIYYAWYHAFNELEDDEPQFIVCFVVEVIYNNNVIQTYYSDDLEFFGLSGAKMGAGLKPDLSLNTNIGL